MEPNPLTRTQTILKSLVMANGESIVEIYRVPLSVDFLPSSKIVVAAEASITDLRLFYKLNPQMPLAHVPIIRLSYTKQMEFEARIDSDWASPRKQLNLYLKNINTDWELMGQAPLVKRDSGLPYQLIELIEKFTWTFSISRTSTPNAITSLSSISTASKSPGIWLKANQATNTLLNIASGLDAPTLRLDVARFGSVGALYGGMSTSYRLARP